jgi:flagellar protein FlaI
MFLSERIGYIIKDYNLMVDEVLKNKILYYIKRDFVWYGPIDPLMRDPQIEDISCDGSGQPLFLFHRKYGSVKSNIQFSDEDVLSKFVVMLAQKCGKHISIAEPMLDATMPDGSRIQMTLSKAVTAKGSTFTIRRFKADPITATDLIAFKTISSEMAAYLWLAVENGINALIAGGTAAGKTSTLNAICLFIPRESKIVSIEETREINLPHPNWIPGVVRSGFGEVINDKLAGEIDLYDLMKAALRQRPEYILVGEIRGKEAYVLFQAMATGHTTYSTFHADSASSLIHRLEGKPIEIPRVMLQSLDIVTIQVQAELGEKRVRRVKQIVEIVDIDPMTKEILTNEVFRWDPVQDQFFFSGKSYIMERIRSQHGQSKEEMLDELSRRVEILEWMKDNNIRAFKDVARIVSSYIDTPDDVMEKVRKANQTKQKEQEITVKNSIVEKQDGASLETPSDITINKKE